MRKINYNLKEEDLENYYSEIVRDRDGRYLLHNKISDIDVFLKKIDKLLSFKNIILADFSQLLKMVECFEKYIEVTIKQEILDSYNSQDDKQYIEDFFKARNNKTHEITAKINKINKKKISKEINTKICSVFYGIETILYENGTISNCISEFFMKNSEKLNIKTCYYCNIDFVNVFKNKSKNHFTLDHILPKGKYPYLSISLFNLIPSCYACNSKLKGQKEFEDLDFIHKISPSSDTFDLDNLLKFKLNFDVNKEDFEKKINEVIQIDEIKVELKNIRDEKEVDIFLNMFDLNDRYEFHNIISVEMIEKRKKYSDSQIDEIEKLFCDEGILIDKEMFKKHIFGSVIFEKENTNEPFEKYKKDIAEQLGLIKCSSKI